MIPLPQSPKEGYHRDETCAITSDAVYSYDVFPFREEALWRDMILVSGSFSTNITSLHPHIPFDSIQLYEEPSFIFPLPPLHHLVPILIRHRFRDRQLDEPLGVVWTVFGLV